jgi:hypothetical protein
LACASILDHGCISATIGSDQWREDNASTLDREKNEVESDIRGEDLV